MSDDNLSRPSADDILALSINGQMDMLKDEMLDPKLRAKVLSDMSKTALSEKRLTVDEDSSASLKDFALSVVGAVASSRRDPFLVAVSETNINQPRRSVVVDDLDIDEFVHEIDDAELSTDQSSLTYAELFGNKD